MKCSLDPDGVLSPAGSGGFWGVFVQLTNIGS